ncbi:MFS transporter [Oceanibacterium hippocampi]|uniref:Putative niacin/nicotinamide transporter NaiP n=1 Tax=Oceanibacterium hippocampi TaxID=745714 RepID=A0A1Y5SX81_9PROT|nr:MFS transporter [Oceanibacterium hippocampi]SLN47179.1 Putative niacin/nicotinamide transporter NaiP [Oceanibacterium hippocampi]
MNRFLLLLTASRFTASIAMMIYAGSLPFLLGEWRMSGAEAGAVQSVFNLAYAISLLVTSWLSDHLGAKRVFLASNACSLVSFLIFAFAARSHESALVLYGLVGLTLGGSYTPALMLVADKVPSASRGWAMGLVLAGSSLGYCVAIALAAACIPVIGYRWTWALVALFLCAGFAAALAALRREPNRIHRREPVAEGETRFRESLASRPSVLLTAGYTSHCWELLGMWAWAPAFLTISLAGRIDWSAATLGIVIACILHFSGALATLISGGLSDRFGRKLILVTMALAGAALSYVFGWSIGWGPAVVLVLAALYGFATIADSGVLSTAMTESVAPRHLGSMLALRSILGFGAGAVSPLVFGWILDLTNPGLDTPRNWGWAFAVLGIGGSLATLFAILLPRDRRRPRRAVD